MNEGIESYKDLIVWQKAMELVLEVYVLTNNYPKEELYGLTAHTKKTVISIPSNMAFGSGAELETQIEIGRRLPFGKELNFSKVDSLLDEVMRMLNKMISNLNNE